MMSFRTPSFLTDFFPSHSCNAETSTLPITLSRARGVSAPTYLRVKKMPTIFKPSKEYTTISYLLAMSQRTSLLSWSNMLSTPIYAGSPAVFKLFVSLFVSTERFKSEVYRFSQFVNLLIY